MMLNILQTVKAAIAAMPFVLSAVLIKQVNLKKEERYRQFLMPFIALAYCIVSMYCMNKIILVVFSIFDLLKRFVPFLGIVDWNKWLIMLGNIVIAGQYVVVKSVLLPVSSRLWDQLMGNKIQEDGLFYRYDFRLKTRVLKNEWGHLKYMYSWFYYAAVGIGSVLLIMLYTFSDWNCFQYPFYPVFGIICLGEVVFYLSGLTEREYKVKVLQEDPDEEVPMDFTGLREKYRYLFGDRILHDYYEDRSHNVKNHAAGIIEQLLSSSVSQERAFGKYLEREMRYGNEVKEDYILSALSLMRGESILFANPFYEDLTPCIYFPFNLALLRQGKGLILVGRHGIEEEIRRWTVTGFEKIIHVPSFWKTEILTERKTECDIGILPYKDIYNFQLMEANREFLKEVSFVIILEPSKMISNGQVALNILSRRMETPDKKIVYCSCDKNVDGLVDSLSHIFKTNITEVRATVASAENSTSVYWKADGPYMHHRLFKDIVKYLGGGTSIAAVALKHGIRNITWYSDRRFPGRDIRWIVGQYYEKICKYVGIPVSQENLQNVLEFSSNIWNVPVEDEKCVIVEDEYYNLYEMGRQFATRGRKQAFVNVLASNYLLRDYMCDNGKIFRTDPKAIPQISADFARTKRNGILQLIMMMSESAVSETTIRKELSIMGLPDNLSREYLEELIGEYYDISEYRIVVSETDSVDEYDEINRAIVRCRYFAIQNEDFIRKCVSELQNAYYLAEDDVERTHFLGGRLLGHIYQSYIVGQFHSLAGKYYEIVSVNKNDGKLKNAVIVRRASDHINDRMYYRQLRTYTIDQEGWIRDEKEGCEKVINGIQVASGYLNLSIHTDGYLEMKCFNDLKNAVPVQVDNIPVRNYRRKNALKIVLPGEKVTPQIRFQTCVMMNEIFRSVFPEDYDYITAITDTSQLENVPAGLVFDLKGNQEPDAIYIIEDSQLDMGLIIAVERNLKKFLEIIWDYCDWSIEKLTQPPEKSPEPQGITDDDIGSVIDEIEKGQKPKGIKGIIARIKKWFKDHFGKKKNNPDSSNETEEKGEMKASITLKADTQILAADVDNNGTTFGGEDEEVVSTTDEDGDQSAPAPEAAVDIYMFYGYGEFNPNIDMKAMLDYYSELGFADNPYKKTRSNNDSVKGIEDNYRPGEPGKHFCDFCACDMTGMKYETLNDGRERCQDCSATAISTVEQFRDLYKKIINDMESYYGISINVPVKVEMVNARKLARIVKQKFTVTSGYDGRCVGVAIKSGSGYTLVIENGAPKGRATETIAHELTHIWQYTQWDNKVLNQYPKKMKLLLYEGMAEWASIQYLMLIGEVELAKREEICTLQRKDEYGYGLQLYLKKYPFSKGQHISKDTPFNHPQKPL